MAGLPPFNGFLSKEMFFTAALNIKQLDIFSLETFGVLFPIIAWIASVFTFVYCMIIVFQTFFGPLQQDKKERRSAEASYGMLIAPIALGSFVVFIFIFPDIIGNYLIRPAMVSMFPLFIKPNYLGQPISIRHRVNTELLMTIGISILGTLLYRTFRHWKRIYFLYPRRWTLDSLYNNLLIRLENRSTVITSFYMTGLLRHYLVYIYVLLLFVIGCTFFFMNAVYLAMT